MTSLTKPVRRMATGIIREELVITLYPTRIGIRAKRTRLEYTLPLATVYRLAIDAAQTERRRLRGLKVRAARTPKAAARVVEPQL